MPQSQITTWLDFALQQIAAESYLDDPGGLQSQLTRGNNRVGFDPSTGPLLGVTRFTNVLAERFIAKYDIVSHHADDATGFSATLIRERDQNLLLTNNFTLSIRSTEFPNQAQGGDWERDECGNYPGDCVSGFRLHRACTARRDSQNRPKMASRSKGFGWYASHPRGYEHGCIGSAASPNSEDLGQLRDTRQPT